MKKIKNKQKYKKKSSKKSTTTKKVLIASMKQFHVVCLSNYLKELNLQKKINYANRY